MYLNKTIDFITYNLKILYQYTTNLSTFVLKVVLIRTPVSNGQIINSPLINQEVIV